MSYSAATRSATTATSKSLTRSACCAWSAARASASVRSAPSLAAKAPVSRGFDHGVRVVERPCVAGVVAAEHRSRPGGHRLGEHDAEALASRRGEDGEVRGGHEAGLVLIRDESLEAHGALESVLRDEPLDAARQGGPDRRCATPRWPRALGGKQGECLDKLDRALALYQPTEEGDDRAAGGVGGPRLGRRLGRDVVDAHRVGDHRRVDAEGPLRKGGGGRGHGGERVEQSAGCDAA